MAHLRKLIIGTCAAALMASGVAAKSDITVAMQLEPPHLDPTSAAAGAIDSVLYSNVFEGLTRFMGGTDQSYPDLRNLGKSLTMA